MAYVDVGEFGGKVSPGSFPSSVGLGKILHPGEKSPFSPRTHSRHFYVPQFPRMTVVGDSWEGGDWT